MLELRSLLKLACAYMRALAARQHGHKRPTEQELEEFLRLRYPAEKELEEANVKGVKEAKDHTCSQAAPRSTDHK